jgi:hypothetical protein
MSVPAAERKKDYHAGPGDSFPLGTAGQHLKAAWDLAGHAANPDEVRAHIRAFAREHGLTDMLPSTAKDDSVKKATSATAKELLQTAWDNADDHGDSYQKGRLAEFAAKRGLAHHLPPEAHTIMHQQGIVHAHEGVTNDHLGFHTHPIVKAYHPISKQGIIVKSWDSGDDVHTEGWLSTPDRDLEKDETVPEAFIPSMDQYFARRAPLSIEHDGKTLPIGHLQKAAVVRDGKILKAASHPTDPSEFEHFPNSGTGVWARARVNEEPGKTAVRKGNVGGFSFIANATKLEHIPGGRYRYLEFSPWMESTIAAYPINPNAVIQVAKAFGLKEQDNMQNELTLEELLTLAAKAQEEKEVQKGITLESLGTLFGQFETKILNAVDERVSKAMPARGEGVGRQSTVNPSEDPRDKDPVSYIVQKSLKPDELDTTDKQLIWALTEKVLTDGMSI